MTTDLGAGVEVPADGMRRRGDGNDGPSLADQLWFVKPILSVLLGILLGAENLNAVGVAGLLRVPALLAALILVAQGPVEWGQHRRAEELRTEFDQERLRDSGARHPDGDTPGGTDADLAQKIPRAYPADGTDTTSPTVKELEAQAQEQALAARIIAGTSVGENRTAVVGVLILAIWLGLATLNYSSAPAPLLWLSLIASFLLFTSAWGMLQKRPA